MTIESSCLRFQYMGHLQKLINSSLMLSLVYVFALKNFTSDVLRSIISHYDIL